MNEFIKINSVFDNNSGRIIDELKKIYFDKKRLQKYIKNLIYDSFLKNNNLKGKSIFLKPNWVRHSIHNYDEICLRTNDNFLLAFIELLLELSPKSILIGDAPIQSCKWDKMLSTNFFLEINLLSKRYNIPIIIKDYRRVIFDVLNNELKEVNNKINEYIIFDLGNQSYLEPISNDENNFRVTYYDYNRLSKVHKIGVHKYCITKDFFNNDIFISIPKIKTHQKTGITCALKNLVGLNGDKDYLPHHRIGGTGRNGDCYPGNSNLRYFSEKLMDIANKNIGKPQFLFWKKLSILFWKLSNPKLVHQRAAGWYGNDTCWRMVMDINKIAIYGTNDGRILEKPQRIIYTLCDGIIGGQGNGPLKPSPLPLGIIAFSNNSYITDIITAMLMGFNINLIYLLKAAINEILLKEIEIFIDDKSFFFNDFNIMNEINSLSLTTSPPSGWIEYLNNNENCYS